MKDLAASAGTSHLGPRLFPHPPSPSGGALALGRQLKQVRLQPGNGSLVHPSSSCSSSPWGPLPTDA